MSEYAVINPATGETLAEYPTIADAELEGKVAQAAEAYTSWSKTTTPAERGDLLREVARLHRERRDELARIIVREMGKPIEQALGEVDFSADIYEYYADTGPGLLQDQPIELLDGEGSALLRHSPVGVLLGIMPWNFPYYQVARFAGPNLVVGNPIVLKHAPQCPESAAAIEKIYADAGFPAGSYVNIYATTDQVAALIPDPRIQGVSLTGSERAGSAVAEIAGRSLKKVVLELGGSDPFILFSTHDMDATVGAAVDGRLDNSGQACNAAKRFIVAEDLYDEFLEKFTAAMAAVNPADPEDADTVLGPLSSTAATDRLAEQLGRALDAGAKAVTGGGRNGNFFESTVLTGITEDNPAYREEFFGPVGQVYRVSSEEEALALANDTPFGLGSYVFTTDPEQAMRLADGIDSGMVFINAVGAEGVELPFGGVKRSGFGRELGTPGIGEFVNKKMIRIAG